MLKDILKVEEQWDLLAGIGKFETTRGEYKTLLEKIIGALEKLNDLETLTSFVWERWRNVPEERRNDVRDVRSLVQVLEEMNVIGVDCLNLFRELFIELNNDELLAELKEFQNRRTEDEKSGRRKAQAAAVWSNARAVCQKIVGVLKVHCTLRNFVTGCSLAFGVGELLRRSSTLQDFVDNFRQQILPEGTRLLGLSEESVCFMVQGETSLALVELYERYSNGRLQEDLQKFLVTDAIRQLADGEEVVVLVHIDEKEFREACDDLINVDKEDSLQGLSALPNEFEYFVDRETELNKLSHIVECLDPKEGHCQGVFIHGAPGIGKTTLAIKAAHKLLRDDRNVLVAYIDCKDTKSFKSFAGRVLEQICRSPHVLDDPAAEIKNRIKESKDLFYILFLDNFEYFHEENKNQQQNQPSTAAVLPCGERVKSFIGEIAQYTTNIKFLVTSSESLFLLETIKPMHLIPFTEVESTKLVEKVRGVEISDIKSKILCEICSGLPLVLCTLISSEEDLIGLLDDFEKSKTKRRANFLWKMKVAQKEKKMKVCLDLWFERLTLPVQLTLLRLCLYKGLFTPDRVAKIFCSPKSSEHDLRDYVLELGRCNLLHQQKSQGAIKYTFLTVIREHFKLTAKTEYREEIQQARNLLIDYLISFMKKTFKVFLGKSTVKEAIEEFSAEKENVMQQVEWIDKDKMDEERIKKCIDVFNVAGEMLAKMMAKFNYRTVYESLAKKSREIGDQRRLAECLTSLGIEEIFNCICATGLCDKALVRARRCLDEAHEIQTNLGVNKGNSRAQCLAKLGCCLVKSGDTERGKAMIQEAIRIRKAAVQTPDDHQEEGGENVCHVMLGATYNDKAVALSFENDHREAVKIRKNQVMPIYRERLGDHPFTATILNNLSNNHRDMGEFKAAEEYAEQALDIRRKLLADHWDTTKSLFDLGMALKANGKFREARGFLEQCKTMQKKVVNDNTLEEKTEEELRDVSRLEKAQDQ
ncbi:uncharacterized protein [Acropora muricata]